MSAELHRRVAALERGSGRQQLEVDVLHDLPEPGQPGGLRCRVNGDALLFAWSGEDAADFRARCRRSAPPGAVLVFYME